MVGSGNLVMVFAVSGDTPSIAADATPLVEFSLIEKNNLTGMPKLHNIQLAIDHLMNDVTLAKFIDDYVSESAGTEPQEVTLEDGTKESTGTSGGDPELVVCAYIGVAGAYRQQFVFPAEVTSDTGAESTTGGQFTRRGVTLKAIKATKAIGLPSTEGTFYPATHVDLVAAASTMPKNANIAIGTSCVEQWIAKGTKDV